MKEKTREQLEQELKNLRQQVASLKASEARWRQTEKALIRNLEERLVTEETLRQRNRELTLLHRVGQTFTATLDLDQVFAVILEEVRSLLEVVACSLWLIDPETEELICRQVTDPQSKIVNGWRLAPGQGIAGWVAQHGESVLVGDTHTDERHFKGVDRQTGLLLRSILTVPLWVKQEVIGVLQVVDEKINRFNETDLRLLEPLATSAAIAIENARLYKQVESYAVEMAQRVAERTQELSTAYEQLKELDKLKSRFVTDISHELRTPVTNIKLYLHLLQKKPHKSERYLVVINEQTERLMNLVEVITDLSRLDLDETKVKFTAVNLNDIARQVIAAHRSRAEASDLELIFDPAQPAPSVRADPNQLIRVIANLMDNAVNYTPSGQIRVSTHINKEQGQACIEVQDTGMGIDAEDLPYIFDRFYRGRGVGSSTIPGNGLGLSIAKTIIDLHKGEITVESQVNKGSTFTVCLPLAKT